MRELLVLLAVMCSGSGCCCGDAWQASCVPSPPSLPACTLPPFSPPPAGDNRIIIHGGANTVPWELGEGAAAAIRGAGAVLLQREIPEAVNLEVAQASGVCC